MAKVEEILSSTNTPSVAGTRDSGNDIPSPRSVKEGGGRFDQRQNRRKRCISLLGWNARSAAEVVLEEPNYKQRPDGYPRLAAYLSSDANFMVYRSFSYLSARVLVELQWRLERLEKELQDVDYLDAQGGRKDLLQSRIRDYLSASGPEGLRCRTEILDETKRVLQEYNSVLKTSRELNEFSRPSDRDYRSVHNWITNEQPLIAAEQAWIKRKEDLVTPRRGRDAQGFDGLIEALLHRLNNPLIRWIFETEEERKKTRDANTQYFSPRRVTTLATLVITLIASGLLVLPVFALYRVTEYGGASTTGQGKEPQTPLNALLVLIVFTLMFCACMSCLTRASRQELFAASAAYCAVLVVFVGNVGGSGGSG